MSAKREGFSQHARTLVASVPELNPQGSDRPSEDGVYMVIRPEPIRDQVRKKLVSRHGWSGAMSEAAAAHTTVWNGVVAPPTAGRFMSVLRRLKRPVVVVPVALVAMAFAAWLLFGG